MKKGIKAFIVIIIVLAAVFAFLYFKMGRTWLANSNDVSITYEKIENTVELTFKAKKDGFLISPHPLFIEKGEVRSDESGDIATVYEMKKNFINSILGRNSDENRKLRYEFKDENNLLTPEGKVRQLSEDDVLMLKFKNKTEYIKFKDLYKGDINSNIIEYKDKK
ncbi:hypothetical protein [Miniphocaeibacter halophilus]|uniref:Uncharacterized protein n=1 Tax=Miniphocaeibacter halophilus TaxID=2931922 RepID=A0AC61MX69_9FIRM|nr:hypothetical protein [Miniphocaeibacter halophilus]QQK08864.1 hypothetical protein JFY71_04835 [Miniphocaeibacter halophilus]